MNVSVVSFFMNNINSKTVELQRKVVEKFNVLKYPHFQFQTEYSHAQSMDLFWKQLEYNAVSQKIPQEILNEHVVIFLDIDAFPVANDALSYLVNTARNGFVVGNVQRSNHIQNNEHLFVAPSVCAMTYGTFCKIGKPSAEPNSRGDVGEEYTWAAEENNVAVKKFLPLKFEKPVVRMAWETDQSPGWALRAGMPTYGIGTTFGYPGAESMDAPPGQHKGPDRPMFYHNFQIFHPGNQEFFWTQCEEVLK